MPKRYVIFIFFKICQLHGHPGIFNWYRKLTDDLINSIDKHYSSKMESVKQWCSVNTIFVTKNVKGILAWQISFKKYYLFFNSLKGGETHKPFPGICKTVFGYVHIHYWRVEIWPEHWL